MAFVVACPACKGAMQEVNREGVMIDVCTQCRGVWLDRGELDKLLSLGRQDYAGYQTPPQSYQEPHPGQYQRHPQQVRYRDDDDDDYYRKHGRRKKSAMERIFDVFD